MDRGSPADAVPTVAIARAFGRCLACQVARLLRVVLVMTRIQRSRERYRRMKMIGLAAPVEKVFEIISDLRNKVR